MKKFLSLFRGAQGNKFINIFWYVAIAGFISGVICIFTSITYVNRTAQKIETKLNDMNRLLTIKAELDKALSVKRSFDRMNIKQPPVFSELLETNKSLGVPDQIHENSKTIGNGWSLVLQEISFKDANIMKIVELARKIENTGISSNKLDRPVWRVSEYTIKTIPGHPGHANIKITFTSLRAQ
jgi:hypothetical protein